MVGHGGSSAGSYPADPTSPIPSHCASVVVTCTLEANREWPKLPAYLNNVYSVLIDDMRLVKCVLIPGKIIVGWM